MQNQNIKSPFILGFFIFLGLSVLGITLGSSAIKYREYERSVIVKGLSEKEVPADIALWPIQYTVATNDLTKIYNVLGSDTNRIVDFLISRGFEQSEITISAPLITDKLALRYNNTNRFKFRYTAVQNISVYSNKISNINSTKIKLSELGKQGIVFSGNKYENRIEYFFTKLSEIKPSMVEDATQKARNVAEKFAQDSNSKLGKIKRASQGKFSIKARNKNTPHIKK